MDQIIQLEIANVKESKLTSRTYLQRKYQLTHDEAVKALQAIHDHIPGVSNMVEPIPSMGFLQPTYQHRG